MSGINSKHLRVLFFFHLFLLAPEGFRKLEAGAQLLYTPGFNLYVIAFVDIDHALVRNMPDS